MIEDVIRWSDQLPGDIDAFLGVPRSGLLVANLLALHRNTALGTSDGTILRGGMRDSRETIKKALLVDDSLNTGRALKRAQLQLANSRPQFQTIFGAVYVHPDRAGAALHYKKISTPRVFEWNMFHGYWLQRACVDIDGVLCRDPIQLENDDGPRYIKFLTTVEPRYQPSVPIHTIVTSRLEKFRTQTEAWLNNHRVKYQKLIMHPASSKKERIALNDYGKRKAMAYDQSGCSLFIESSVKRAKEIFQFTHKPVICTDNMVLYA